MLRALPSTRHAARPRRLHKHHRPATAGPSLRQAHRNRIAPSRPHARRESPSTCRLWSCRESNPGPTACPQGFSVRSPLRLSRISRSHGLAGMTIPVAVRCSGESRDRTHRWIPLADVRVRAEGVPGLTDLLSLRQRERSRADLNRRLIGCIDAYGGLLPAPARFP